MKNLDIIYFAARELPPGARASYLDKVCGDDVSLRKRVEQMLAVAGEAEAFIADLPNGASKSPQQVRESVKTQKLEMVDSADAFVGQKIGPYKILECLGEGGCGVVYVAEQTEPVRRRVALKVIKLGMDTKQVVARFEAERQALAMMDHPNIAKVLDAGATDYQGAPASLPAGSSSNAALPGEVPVLPGGRPYFVMELVRGIKITDYCDQANLETKDRIALFMKVCQAIQHAHQKGIIHRDIKPSNILVTLHDAVPVPKVIDFGIAKATEGRLTDHTVYTQLHQFVGTPAYTSPEQAEMSGLDIDTRSDIYSLGVLLYELLTGSTPFDPEELLASGIDEMRRTIREKDPPRPSTKLSRTLGAGHGKKFKSRSSGSSSSEEEEKTASRRFFQIKETISRLKGDLDWIVMKCLEKDRTRRYETANGLAADLQRHLDNEPVMARPPSAGYRFQKAFRRNKLIFFAAGSVAGALLLGVGVSTWQAVRATQAERAERIQAGLALVDRDRALQAQSTAVQQRDLAQQRLYDSLVREAQSIRTIRPLGFRRQLIDRIQKALAIPNAKKDIDELRTEIAQCLGDAIGFDPVNLIDPPAAFLDVALTPDGTLVAYGTEQGHLVLHETVTGKRIGHLENYAPLARLAFAPDGHSLFGYALEPVDVNPGMHPRISLIEWRRAGDGSWSRITERSIPGLRHLAATQQGVIAVIENSSRREIRLAHAATDRPIGSIPLMADQSFPAVLDVSSDNRLVAFIADSGTNQPDNIVEIWDLQANQRRFRLDPGLGPVHHLQFNSDSRFLACTAENGVLALETSQFERVNTYRRYMTLRAVWCVDGARLALPHSQENEVRLVSVISGTEATRLTTDHQVRDVRSSLDGSVLLVVPHTGSTIVVRLAGSRERRRLSGHIGGVPGVEFSPDGRTIASTGKDGTIRIWESQTGQTRHTWRIPRGDHGQTVAFSHDGRWLASGNYQNNQVLVWDLADGRRVLALGDGATPLIGTWTCGFNRDGRFLVTAGDDGLRGWELMTRTADAKVTPLEAREIFHHPGITRNLQFDPSGKWVGFEGKLESDGETLSGSFIRGLEPKEEPILIGLHSRAVQTLGFGGDGTLLHMDKDRSLVVTSPQSRQIVRRLPTLAAGEFSSTFVMNFKVSPDGTQVAVSNHNGRGVNIHDLASGRRLYTLPDDAGSIWWLAWHPDGRTLAVARGNGDISLWNLTEVKAVLATVGLSP